MEERSLLMIGIQFDRTLRAVVCIGAHADDIEIGAAGLISSLAEKNPACRFLFAIAAGSGVREQEAVASARNLLGDRVDLIFGHLSDGMLPYSHPVETKEFVREASSGPDADLVITTHTGDRHQDHRFIAELSHQIFRSQMILEYEIPKLEGDLGTPTVYHPMTSEEATAKVEHLSLHFESQHQKAWYHPEMFTGLMRIRGTECLASDGYAEAFHANRITL